MQGKTTIIFILIALLLAGCGQKGPLYLPEDEQSQSEESD